MSIVYKFLPTARISYLENELLRITQPGDLNDPFECLPVPPTVSEIGNILKVVMQEDLSKYSLTKKQRKAYEEKAELAIKSVLEKIRSGTPGNFKEQFINDGNKNINNKLGILSLSRRWNSSLMWSHYTNSHKGFCLGFDTETDFFKPFRQIADTSKIFMPVIYSNERIKIPINKGEKIDMNIMLTKSKDWEYEDEERLIVSLENAQDKKQEMPFDIYLYKVPHNLIKEIIVGTNISNEYFSTIKQFCENKKIDLYKTIVSEKKFDMERIKLYSA